MIIIITTINVIFTDYFSQTSFRLKVHSAHDQSVTPQNFYFGSKCINCICGNLIKCITKIDKWINRIKHLKYHVYKGLSWKVHWLKSLYDDVISTVDIIFDNWDQSTVTPKEKACWRQGGLSWKISLVWLLFLRVSWSDYELFSGLCYFLLYCHIMQYLFYFVFIFY